MASLNRTKVSTSIVNHEGGRAKRISAEDRLRRTVMSCLLWEDSFYEDGESIADRIRKGVDSVELGAAAEIAIEAREQMHLRHTPLWILRNMVRHGGLPGSSIIGSTLARIIQRPDELTEFLAMYWKDGKTPLSSQAKKGLAEAFRKFDEYQLAKYNRLGKDITLRDVLFLVHPKPLNKAQQNLWDRLVADELDIPDTWETALSSGKDKQAVWSRLLKEKKLGGLALLRNLRNMKDAGITRAELVKAINEHKFDRVLPFRFISAARYAPELESVLEQAMFRALEPEVGTLKGSTALILDNSGSMASPVSAKSDISRRDAAAGVAMLLREICEDVTVIGYGSDAKILPDRRGFALRDAYINGPGGNTYTDKAKKLADHQGYDRIIIITDEQAHDNLSAPKPGTKGYVINVGTDKNGIGYGKWTHIDGWSEAVVKYIQAKEALDEQEHTN